MSPAMLLTLALTLEVTPAKAQPGCLERPDAIVADQGQHVVNFGYQRTLGCLVAVQMTAGLYGPWTVNYNVLGLGGEDHDPPGDVIGFVVRVRPFIYPLQTAPEGLWISPFTQLGRVWGARSGEELTGNAFAAGLSAGWAWRPGEAWLLAVGAGAQYHRAALSGSTAFPGFARFAPQIDVNIDYLF